jgi:hypothetical protein
MKRILATIAVLAALAFPAGVLADTTGGGDIPPAGQTGGMTIELRSVHLTTRAVAQVQVAFSCPPKPAPDGSLFTSWDSTFLFVDVRQANGRTIAFGSAFASFDGDAVCDGTSHLLTVGVTADPSSVPFKTGSAAVGAAGNASYSTENWDTGEFGFVPASASTGWLAMKLTK